MRNKPCKRQMKRKGCVIFWWVETNGADTNSKQPQGSELPHGLKAVFAVTLWLQGRLQGCVWICVLGMEVVLPLSFIKTAVRAEKASNSKKISIKSGSSSFSQLCSQQKIQLWCFMKSQRGQGSFILLPSRTDWRKCGPRYWTQEQHKLFLRFPEEEQVLSSTPIENSPSTLFPALT